MTVVWLDGRVVGAGEARVDALDRGLTVGDGVFTTCLVLGGTAVALTRHLRRLGRSAAVLGLAPPDETRVRLAVAETLAAAGDLPRGRLRITLTGGAGPLGPARGGVPPTLMVAAAPAGPWPERGTAVTVPWTRNERSAVAGAKTTSYAENLVALAEARRRGADEALLGNTRGELCEGTGTNVFLVLGGELVTPPLTSGCLPGITRELFLEWAAAEGLPVAERDLPLAALAAADDVLLTSATRGVQLQAAVDGRPLPGGALGAAAVELYGRRLATGLDP